MGKKEVRSLTTISLTQESLVDLVKLAVAAKGQELIDYQFAKNPEGYVGEIRLAGNLLLDKPNLLKGGHMINVDMRNLTVAKPEGIIDIPESYSPTLACYKLSEVISTARYGERYKWGRFFYGKEVQGIYDKQIIDGTIIELNDEGLVVVSAPDKSSLGVGEPLPLIGEVVFSFWDKLEEGEY